MAILSSSSISSIHTRYEYLDIVCGIMTLYMVLVHFSELGEWSELRKNIFKYIPFFMAWFYFKGGMFFKQGRIDRGFLITSFKRLIVPTLAFTLFGFCLTFWKHDSIGFSLFIVVAGLLKFASTPFNIPLWYLTSLFFVRLICRGLLRSVLSGVCMMTIALLLAYLLWQHEYHELQMLLQRICLGLFFFIPGYLLRTAQYHKWVLYSALLFLVCSLVWGEIPYVHLVSNTLEFGNYLHFFPFCIACIIVTNTFFRWCTAKGFGVLRTLGKNSMFILCTHYPLAVLFSKLCSMYGIVSEGGVEKMCVVGGLSVLAMLLLFPLFKYTRFKVLIGE